MSDDLHEEFRKAGEIYARRLEQARQAELERFELTRKQLHNWHESGAALLKRLFEEQDNR